MVSCWGHYVGESFLRNLPSTLYDAHLCSLGDVAGNEWWAITLRKNVLNLRVHLLVNLFILILALLLSPLQLQATDFYEATTDLRVRLGPGTEQTILFVLKKGDEVELIAKEGDWYKIKFGRKYGFVNGSFLVPSRENATEENSVSPLATVLKWLLVFLMILILFVFSVPKKVRRFLFSEIPRINYGTENHELMVVRMLERCGIPVHCIFHDLYIETNRGSYSQTDVLAVTDAGILVFEVKAYSGWIFGNGNNQKWTQVLNYGREKHRFYNPILQNKSHINAIQRQLGMLGNVPFFSLIVFCGNCQLKDIDFIPHRTFVVKASRLHEAVQSIFRSNPPVEYAKYDEMMNILQAAVAKGQDVAVKQQHQQNIQNMLGRDRLYD